MANKKISELPEKPNPELNDLLPLVDTQNPNKFETKRATVASFLTALDAITQAEKNVPNGVATLNNYGKIPVSQLPAITITNTYVVNSETAMLALYAEVGDVAVRTDISKTFILSGNAPVALNNWQELLAPPAALATLIDVDVGVLDVESALVYDPNTKLWRSTDIAKIVDGGNF